jgi:hypothetical protein
MSLNFPHNPSISLHITPYSSIFLHASVCPPCFQSFWRNENPVPCLLTPLCLFLKNWLTLMQLHLWNWSNLRLTFVYFWFYWCEQLQSLINKANVDGIIKNEALKFKGVKGRKPEGNRSRRSQYEVKKRESCMPFFMTKHVERVLHHLLFSCYTRIRCPDLKNLKNTYIFRRRAAQCSARTA